MLRFRRYRVFLILAIFSLFVLYHFTTVQDWQDARVAGVEKLKHLGSKQTMSVPTPTPMPVATSSSKEDKTEDDPKTDGAETNAGKPVDKDAAVTSKSTPATPTTKPDPATGDFGAFGLSGQGRHEAFPPLEGKPLIHYEKYEHFPLPAESVIALPTEKPTSIPKIQYAFRDESTTVRADREKKLAEIKEAFQHSWSGYRKYAWQHDELSPVSAGFRDPFCSWSATLVDALDSLWIMGMESEFAEAVAAVNAIDFTTSPRKDIPIFETTIRYLGGLLSAYDVSGAKYKILLDKAVELAEVLLGAFDTPNRMPIGYYYWRPTFAKNPHRASTRTVMAEIGSLSMEFTRLAQLTKNNRYYDAVARITDEFEQMQNNTKIPGLWPVYVDASGCRKPELPTYDPMLEFTDQNPLTKGTSKAGDAPPLQLGSATDAKSAAKAAAERLADEPAVDATAAGRPAADRPPIDEQEEKAIAGVGFDTRPDAAQAKDSEITKRKRQIDTGALGEGRQPEAEHLIDTNPAPQNVDCEPQGLDSPPGSDWETFSMGGQADSTFEYLPKMFMLLGGTVPKYRTMHEQVITAVNKHMLYRPMVPNPDLDLRAVGLLDVNRDRQGKQTLTLKPDLTHLTCFVGGMYGIGGKIFQRAEDVETAKKLTDTCVWAYGQTTTGIMPETAKLMACDDMTSCKWDKERWYKELDPWREFRETGERIHLAAEALSRASDAKAVAAAAIEAAAAKDAGSSADSRDGVSSSDSHDKVLSREEVSAGSLEGRAARDEIAEVAVKKRQALADGGSVQEDVHVPSSTTPTENAYPTHEEYVEARLKTEHIAEGIPTVTSPKYILRPEAIESVFIMYRITGDETWRAKGWKMFQAIQKHCRTEYGYSAIGDVSDPDAWQLDEMESFWLAETLKYFYLLFSPPNTISLDEWVLNTEAHPFKRPK